MVSMYAFSRTLAAILFQLMMLLAKIWLSIVRVESGSSKRTADEKFEAVSDLGNGFPCANYNRF